MNVTTELVSVVIAEDKEVMRLGQQQMVIGVGGFHVVGVADDAETLLKVVDNERPDVLVLKDQLPGMELPQLVQSVREVSASTKVLVTLTRPDLFWGALEAKADGYCLREVTAEAFKSALRAVAGGSCYIGSNLAGYLLRGDGYRLLEGIIPRVNNGSSVLESLSRREREVLSLLSEGQSNERIAQTLGLSIQTVKVHVKHILKKLKVSDRTQAVIKALKA